MLNSTSLSHADETGLSHLIERLKLAIDEASKDQKFQDYTFFLKETNIRLEFLNTLLHKNPDELKVEIAKGELKDRFEKFYDCFDSILREYKNFIAADSSRQQCMKSEKNKVVESKQQALENLSKKLRKTYHPTISEFSTSIVFDCMGAAFAYVTKGVGFGSSLLYLFNGAKNTYNHLKRDRSWRAISPLLTASTSCLIAEGVRYTTASNPYSIYAFLSLGLMTNIINRIDQYLSLKTEIKLIETHFLQIENEMQKKHADTNISFLKFFEEKQLLAESKLRLLEEKKNEIIRINKEIKDMLNGSEDHQQIQNNNDNLNNISQRNDTAIDNSQERHATLINFNSKKSVSTYQSSPKKRKRDEIDAESNKFLKLI